MNVSVKRRTPDEKTLCYCNNVAEQPDRRGVFQLIRFRFNLHREARRYAVRYLTFHWHQRQGSRPSQVGQKLKLNSGSGTTAKAGASGKKSSTKRTAAVTPSSAVPQSSWPPVGQRCWRWPTSGKVVLPYSTSDGGNKGIDIAGKRGQPVYAAGAGKVVYVGNQLRGYGNLIMIKHNEDYISAYAHNDKLMVNNGQSVKIGQQIATMGSSDADSVRLHFQIRYRATAIDPLRYLPPQGSKPKC